MKPTLTFLVVFLFSFFLTQNGLAQKDIQADVRLFAYQTPNQDFYVELYVAVLSSTIHKPLDESVSKGVEVTWIAKKGDEIKYADKYSLTTSIESEKDFYDIRRIAAVAGEYHIEAKIVDLSDTSRSITRELVVKLINQPEDVTLSSIQLLGNVTSVEKDNGLAKNGLLMEPLKYNYLNNNYNRLLAYVEAYNVKRKISGNYLLRYDVIRQASARPDTVLTRFKRRTASDVDPILIQESNDSLWNSGKYRLVVSLLDYDQKLLAQASEHFVLSNPKKVREKDITTATIDNSFVQKLTSEELDYALKALTAKVNPLDVERLNQLIANGNIESKRSFIYRYWYFTNQLDAESGYDEYMKVVKAIDDLFFDGFGRGFETDRGYMYLKYGEPDHIVSIKDEPTAPPYQIWTYTEFPATRQNNVKFVFYNPAGTTYNLLHTNARGELNDPQWLLKLYKNSPEGVIGNPSESTQVEDHWNRRAAEYFNDN